MHKYSRNKHAHVYIYIHKHIHILETKYSSMDQEKFLKSCTP